MAGRPPFIATPEEREIVAACSAYGIPHPEICRLIKRPFGKEQQLKPISGPTLRKYFRDELDGGAADLHQRVASGLAKTALDRGHKGHVAASIFILKARFGWSEKVEHSGTVGLELDLSGATLEELEVIERFLARKAEAHRASIPANAA